MKTILILLLFFIGHPTSIEAQKKTKIKGDREVISTSGEIKEPFENIEISDNISVEIQNGPKNSYILTADQNLIEEVEIIVKNNTLKIFTKNKITNRKKLDLYLRLENINSLILNDDAILKNTGKFQANEIRISLHNSSKVDLDLEIEQNADFSFFNNSGGKLDLKADNILINMKDRTDLKGDLDCKELKVTLEKYAGLKINGEANNSIYTLEGSSNLDAKKLKTKNAVLNSKNSSDIYVHATKSIEINAEGKSKVFLYGKPEVKIIGLTDKSRIIKK